MIQLSNWSRIQPTRFTYGMTYGIKSPVDIQHVNIHIVTWINKYGYPRVTEPHVIGVMDVEFWPLAFCDLILMLDSGSFQFSFLIKKTGSTATVSELWIGKHLTKM